MYLETLEEIGLTQNEAKIYEGLLDIGVSSVPQIALKTGVHKRNIYDIIPKMLRKGIVYRIVDAKENRYGPVAPDKLGDLIWEKDEKLKQILPDLTKQYKKMSTNESVYIYKGKEGFKNYLRDILAVGEDVWMVGAKGGWFDKDMHPFIETFLEQAKKKKINYRHIFDHEVKGFAPDLLQTMGKPYRFLPPGYSTTGALDMFGDHVVTFSGLTLKRITDDVTVVVIVNKELADCYRTWFKFMWEHCKE